MRAVGAYATLAAGVTLAGCAPIPVARAEAQCLRIVQSQPRAPLSGEAIVGVGSGGDLRSRLRLDIGTYSSGRDLSADFDACVYRKSGRMPTRPLYARTDWKG